MIKCLSPFYVNIPFISPLTSQICTSFKLNIYVWDGVKATPPSEPSYSITKNNATTSSGSDSINIARLVSDFIEFAPVTGLATGLIDGDNQRWCKTTIVYTSTDANDTDVEQLPVTSLVVKGYSYGMDGENQGLPTNRILISGNEFKVNRTGVFNVPIKILEV